MSVDKEVLGEIDRSRYAHYNRMKEKYGVGWETVMIREAESEIKNFAKATAASGSPFYWLEALIKRIDSDIQRVLIEHRGHGWDFVEDSLYNLGRVAYASFLKCFVTDEQLPDRRALTRNAIGYKATVEVFPYGKEGNAYGYTGNAERKNVYTSATYSMATPTGKYFKEYMQGVKAKLDAIVMLSAKPSYSDRVNLLNIAEMTVRYEDNMNQIESKRENGVRLVWVEPHANCSERCSHWQVGGDRHRSGLYSLDGKSGVAPDGRKYIPIETAIDQFVTTKGGKTYRNGLFGFGCRHRLLDWKMGNKPIPIPASVIEKRRKAEEKQRELEREYRHLREAASLYTGFPGLEGAAKWAREKAAALRKEYEDFTGRNDLVSYDDRLKSFPGEHSPEMQKKIRERTLTQYYKWLDKQKRADA